MKWFQHYSDSYSNLKMQELISEFGIEGYGMFWLTCEIVAQQGENYEITNGKNWKKALANISKISIEKTEKILQKLAELNLIDSEALSENRLFIPKMSEYSDDYTGRKRRVSEQSPNSVRTKSEKVPLDKIRRDKKRLDKTTLDKNIISSDFNLFWTEYPKKEQRQKAEEIWKKKNPPLKEILAFISEAKETDRWRGGYIPNPTTFLNQERWTDDVESYKDKQNRGEILTKSVYK